MRGENGQGGGVKRSADSTSARGTCALRSCEEVVSDGVGCMHRAKGRAGFDSTSTARSVGGRSCGTESSCVVWRGETAARSVETKEKPCMMMRGFPVESWDVSLRAKGHVNHGQGRGGDVMPQGGHDVDAGQYRRPGGH